METENPKAGTSGSSVIGDQSFVNCRDKDIDNFDIAKTFPNPIRQKIYNLLLTGNPYSVSELSNLLHIPDPRSHLRYIKKTGVPLQSCWLQGRLNKYKVYFISGAATASPFGKEA